ncbi:YqiA/YcfP family alpha/beta fold hydrolase [uncultured Psychrobacter sp.]|uniref:YqiA/YcfP family alpha/beta fold hydrolase n=1 Tax=uncultured Psychrobacter sp. TaxID=259303 RepID=UPI00260DE91D|nr:YqiA/YcfP family alpha/beta fold hydrolase [uncultured Psychrobacter sp.]
MNVIYIHGLDSDANSTKGKLLEDYCRQYHSDINILRPDLNKTPDQVFRQILLLIEGLKHNDNIEDGKFKSSNTILVGSSLGGYFSTLVSNHIGCPALLLNPSTQPHVTLQRFAEDSAAKNNVEEEDLDSQVIHSTAGGWDITHADLQWFAAHQLSTINYPDKISVLIKEGDELLNPELSKQFYKSQGATVTMQAGGDHRFSDFGAQLPMVIEMLRNLL